jgi:hypothetical protein
MDNAALKKNFEAIGARAKFNLDAIPPWRGSEQRFTIDVGADRKGEFFNVEVFDDTVHLSALDVRPRDHHLLLISDDQQRILCGHDERHWFAAGVEGAGNVEKAKEALKPPAVLESQHRNKLKKKSRNTRKNHAFVRQGEWFFIPAPDLIPDEWVILNKEPIRRGQGKPHMVENVYRRGGTTVYVCSQYPNGLAEREYKTLLRNHPEKKGLPWQQMARGAEVYAKGRVRHPDHKTIVLPFWHRVLPNKEVNSASVAFLD